MTKTYDFLVQQLLNYNTSLELNTFQNACTIHQKIIKTSDVFLQQKCSKVLLILNWEIALNQFYCLLSASIIVLFLFLLCVLYIKIYCMLNK